MKKKVINFILATIISVLLFLETIVLFKDIAFFVTRRTAIGRIISLEKDSDYKNHDTLLQ